MFSAIMFTILTIAFVLAIRALLLAIQIHNSNLIDSWLGQRIYRIRTSPSNDQLYNAEYSYWWWLTWKPLRKPYSTTSFSTHHDHVYRKEFISSYDKDSVLEAITTDKRISAERINAWKKRMQSEMIND